MSINNPDTNDHPLTVARAAEMWDEHHTPAHPILRWALAHESERKATLALLRAAHDAGREYERANPEDDRPREPQNDPNVKIIEHVTRDDVRPGDHLVWESTREKDGVTITERREGIAHHRDSFGDWWTEGGAWLTLGEGEGVTLTIRRPIQELPTEPGAVIVPADGHEYIEATLGGVTCRTREAFLSAGGLWMGVWRSSSGQVLLAVSREFIVQDTWKVDDR